MDCVFTVISSMRFNWNQGRVQINLAVLSTRTNFIPNLIDPFLRKYIHYPNQRIFGLPCMNELHSNIHCRCYPGIPTFIQALNVI